MHLTGLRELPSPQVATNGFATHGTHGPPCEIICRPGWEKLCPTASHPAEIIAVKSCGCHQLICRDAMNTVLHHTVVGIGLECQQCHELEVVTTRWFPL